MNSSSRPLALTRAGRLGIAAILGLLSAFGPLSLDMYLPALPKVAADLYADTSLAQLSLTACLLGLSLGQLLAGPLSDVRGRRLPLLVGLALYTIVSLLCLFSPSIWPFVLLRFVQGLAGAAGIVICRAVARDLYAGAELTRFFSLLMLVNGAAPILAPVIGGQLLRFTDWRGVFVVLGLIGAAALAAVLFGLPETLPADRRSGGGLAPTLRTLLRIARDREFMGYALAQGFVTAAMFAYIAGSPFVLQDIFGVSPQTFSFIFGTNGVGIILASQLTGRLAGRIGEARLLAGGLVLAAAGGLALLTAIAAGAGLWGVLPPLFVVVSCVGVVGTASFPLAMRNQGRSAGSASALLGVLSFIFGGIVSPLVGLGGSGAALPMGIVIAAADLTALLLYAVMVRRRKAGVARPHRKVRRRADRGAARRRFDAFWLVFYPAIPYNGNKQDDSGTGRREMDNEWKRQARFLIVAEEAGAGALERILRRAGYGRIVSAANSREFARLYREAEPDLVLIDLHMPELNGFALLKQLGEWIQDSNYIPVVVLTTEGTSEERKKALFLGANEYLTKPLDRTEVALRIQNLLKTRYLHLQLQNQKHLLEHKVEERTSELQQAKQEILELLARTSEYRDDDTGRHTHRVGELAYRVAMEMGFGALHAQLIRQASPLHDIGKIGIPDSILLKPGRFTAEEFEHMKQHTTIGANILDGSFFPALQLAGTIAVTHHEKWDGTGYPGGLSGEEIPLAGRIVAIADFYDALTHERPYKRAWTREEALAEIERQRGAHFDPQVVDAFLNVVGKEWPAAEEQGDSA